MSSEEFTTMTKVQTANKKDALKVPKQLSELANSKGVRNWCFTWNNYTPPDEEFLKNMKVKWIVYEREIAPTTGTPHLQGAVIFNDQKTFSALNRMTKKKCIWAPMICPASCSEQYCKKEGGPFYEFGSRPVTKKEQGQNEQQRWDEIRENAKAGKLDAIPSAEFIRHYSTLKRIAVDYAPDPVSLLELDNEWIYGEQGTGKSFPFEQLRDNHKSCFFKTHDNVWQGYRGEPVVCIDEFEPEHRGMLGLLKQWMGKGVIEAKVLYAHGKFRPKRIIITSNHHPSVIWPGVNLGPLYRRMKIYRQTAFGERIYEDSGFYTPATIVDPTPEEVFGDDEEA